ncbi:MAG: divalent cation tolerance protein CutA [Candidatus Methanoplasma sp.]|jgi:hypothetical protein|nr:divalent cation tolerance protein CutA [Candidatus Methanoplasma sp.]
MPTKQLFKISVNIPEEFADALMDAVTAAMNPVFPNYDRVFATSRVTGTWRPLPGAKPYDGSVGEITKAEEIRIEFRTTEKDLSAVLRKIKEIHPYEEPVVDVDAATDWNAWL